MSINISWIKPEDLVTHELRQRAEEGLDISAYRQHWEQLVNAGGDTGTMRAAAKQLLAKLSRLRAPATLEENEPSGWEEIQSKCPERPSEADIVFSDPDSLYDRIYGGWLGRSAGCLLGKPVEKISREGIREILTSNQTWPLSDYITARGIPEELLRRYPWNRHSGKESLRENIVCMTEDDDMNYPMINLWVLENYGRDFRSEDVAEAWLTLMPVLACFTAERVAYLNSLALLSPPQTALVNNPYREWIGAQIRADIWGWVCPGDPRRAAALAWRDARLSHVRNGIYGEMFFAALIAAAFRLDDPAQLLLEGLQYIPPGSRLAHAVSFVIDLHRREKVFEAAVDHIYRRFGHYHWVHTINNAALVAAALLYGKGDFETTICSVVMGGWDTDSNGATAGSVLGTLLGARRLPGKWIDPLNDRIRSSMKGFDNSAVSSLAQRTVRQIKD
ncbi:MAG: ADP-ribosylglycohydrolase family protein [Calditrichaeota bacterium]|nr:ADP-ribosylglycohydrolase family protein [Calditrichota bacterium]